MDKLVLIRKAAKTIWCPSRTPDPSTCTACQQRLQPTKLLLMARAQLRKKITGTISVLQSLFSQKQVPRQRNVEMGVWRPRRESCSKLQSTSWTSWILFKIPNFPVHTFLFLFICITRSLGDWCIHRDSMPHPDRGYLCRKSLSIASRQTTIEPTLQFCVSMK